MKRAIWILVGLAGGLVMLPVAVSATGGGDALAGLKEVLASMIQAYIEFLKHVP